MQTEGSGGGKTCGRTVETGASVGAYLGVPPGERAPAKIPLVANRGASSLAAAWGQAHHGDYLTARICICVRRPE